MQHQKKRINKKFRCSKSFLVDKKRTQKAVNNAGF